MLDGINARANGAFGAFVAVRVGGGLAAQRVSLINDSVQLFLGKLRRVYIVRFGQDSSGSADFDDVRAVLVIKAHCIARLFRTVDHTTQRIAFGEKSLTKSFPGI